MISLPDELLARVDAEAKRRGTSRSAVIRACAEQEFDRRNERLAARMRELDAEQVGNYGGNGVELIRAARRSRGVPRR